MCTCVLQAFVHSHVMADIYIICVLQAFAYSLVMAATYVYLQASSCIESCNAGIIFNIYVLQASV